jgi:hypothetical protein
MRSCYPYSAKHKYVQMLQDTLSGHNINTETNHGKSKTNQLARNMQLQHLVIVHVLHPRKWADNSLVVSFCAYLPTNSLTCIWE